MPAGVNQRGDFDMKQFAKSGAVLAAAAFSMAVSGAAFAPVAQADDAKVHCSGVNACKGQGECKTATNACKGQAACKGQGWISLSKADCDAKGGKVIEG
jgi:uncharacterized membrane protein